VEALLPQLAAGGVRELVLAPIGFITDNVEVLYDLDIAAQGLAAACGVRVVRAALLNDTAPLIAALAAVARERP
jgi:ferrochelatase